MALSFFAIRALWFITAEAIAVDRGLMASLSFARKIGLNQLNVIIPTCLSFIYVVTPLIAGWEMPLGEHHDYSIPKDIKMDFVKP